MTAAELISSLSLTVFALPEPDRAVTGGYTGDLLSWVMGRAQSGDAWVTIMSNVNVVAVASLTDVACVILAESVSPDAGTAETAAARGINLLGSAESAFALCGRIRQLL